MPHPGRGCCSTERRERTMAVKGQTHAKRARELALKERRERKQAKKEAQRAAANAPDADEANGEPTPEPEPETASGWIQ
jgi:hypothetical protein